MHAPRPTLAVFDQSESALGGELHSAEALFDFEDLVRVAGEGGFERHKAIAMRHAPLLVLTG